MFLQSYCNRDLPVATSVWLESNSWLTDWLTHMRWLIVWLVSKGLQDRPTAFLCAWLLTKCDTVHSTHYLLLVSVSHLFPDCPYLGLLCFLLPVEANVGFTHSLTPWHYSPDGHKPPLYGSIAWFSVFEEQVANLLPQHFSESAWFNNQSHLVAKQENITGEKRVRKFGRQSISLMLC
jgi:hypothetical protein